jgi:hypothetical protein
MIDAIYIYISTRNFARGGGRERESEKRKIHIYD